MNDGRKQLIEQEKARYQKARAALHLEASATATGLLSDLGRLGQSRRAFMGKESAGGAPSLFDGNDTANGAGFAGVNRNTLARSV